MTFQWGDYLEFAKLLISSTDSAFMDARKRSSISRAYYAAFNWASDYAEEHCDYTPPKDPSGSHRHLTDCLDAHNLHVISEKLKRAKGARVDCDYHAEADILDKLVGETLSDCSQIFTDLQSPTS